MSEFLKDQKTRNKSLLLALLLLNGEFLNGQTITTDRVNYIPGEMVVASGKGWLPGETVTLVLTEQVINPACPVVAQVTATSDSRGNLNINLYRTLKTELGGFFHLSATGTRSDHKATITFNNSAAAATYSSDNLITDGLADIKLNIYPNPFETIVSFELEMTYDSNVKLEIYSNSGNLIKVILHEDLRQGDFRKAEFDSGGYLHTVYMYRLVTRYRIVTGTIMKTL